MLSVHVSIQVKPECIEHFIEATEANARGSLKEPGIVRFDFAQNKEDPARFVLVEVFRDAEAPARHKATAHFALWKETVADMMAVPRSSTKFETLFPEPSRWES